MVASRRSTDALTKPFTYRSDANEPLSLAVLAAVGSVSGRRPTKSDAAEPTDVLPPLYDAIDPDALDALFRRRSACADGARGDGGRVDGPRQVVFSYHGFRVTARSDGSVTVEAE